MSSHQSPMISIPRKTTDEVDWTTPIRNLIAKSYGENPDTYAQEYLTLQRCRQDAVKGAGSDITGLLFVLAPLAPPFIQSQAAISSTSTLASSNSSSCASPRFVSISLARCLHQQGHHADIHRLREGVHSLPDRCHPFRHRRFSEQVRSRGPEARVSLLPHVCWHAHVYQRELSTCTLDGPQSRSDQVLGRCHPCPGYRGLSREMYRGEESKCTRGKDCISGRVHVFVPLRGSKRFHGKRCL